MREGQVPRQWLQSTLFQKSRMFKSGLEQTLSSPHLPLPIFFLSFPLLFLDGKALIGIVWETFLKPGCLSLARASSRPGWIRTWPLTGSFLGILGQGSHKGQQMGCVREMASRGQETWPSLVPLPLVTGSPLCSLLSVSRFPWASDIIAMTGKKLLTHGEICRGNELWGTLLTT